MRTVLAVLMFVSGTLALNATADAARKRHPRPHHAAASRYYYPRAVVECERARHEDPTGLYGGFPCWAREAFGRGAQGIRR